MEVLTGILWKNLCVTNLNSGSAKEATAPIGQLSKEQASQHFWLLCVFSLIPDVQLLLTFQKL